MPASRPLRTGLRRAPAPIRSRHSPIPPGGKVGKRRAIGPGPKQLVGASDASKQPPLTAGPTVRIRFPPAASQTNSERPTGSAADPAKALGDISIEVVDDRHFRGYC